MRSAGPETRIARGWRSGYRPASSPATGSFPDADAYGDVPRREAGEPETDHASARTSCAPTESCPGKLNHARIERVRPHRVAHLPHDQPQRRSTDHQIQELASGTREAHLAPPPARSGSTSSNPGSVTSTSSGTGIQLAGHLLRAHHHPEKHRERHRQQLQLPVLDDRCAARCHSSGLQQPAIDPTFASESHSVAPITFLMMAPFRSITNDSGTPVVR